MQASGQTSKMLTALVPLPTIEGLRRLAAANELTLSAEVRRTLHSYVRDHDQGAGR